jgi:FKBP-type peptidyl-prolyl cis-trans isomerase FkpA
MAEVTRVPLQPTSRGSRALLVVGVVLALLIAAGFAWATAPAGVSVQEVRAGTGESPKPTDVVFVNYTGKLADGTVFDQSQPLPLPVPGILPEGTPLPLENMVPGFREAALQMQRGGKYTVEIPAEKAYGAEGRINPQTGEGVPPNADLTFEIELVDFLPMAEVEQRFAAMQQMMAQQQPPAGAEGGAAPGGAPAPAPAPPPAPAP